MKISGFTLMEILLVVVIIGIMSVMGVNLINSQSIERQILNEAAMLEAQVNFICDQSILENRAHGIEWTENDQWVLKHQSGDWSLVETTKSSFTMDRMILLNGLEQILLPDPEELPHVICQTDGSFNPFEVKWPVFKGQKVESFYSLKSETPYQLTGAWVEK